MARRCSATNVFGGAMWLSRIVAPAAVAVAVAVAVVVGVAVAAMGLTTSRPDGGTTSLVVTRRAPLESRERATVGSSAAAQSTTSAESIV